MQIGGCYAMLTYITSNGRTCIEKITGNSVAEVHAKAKDVARDAKIFTVEFPAHLHTQFDEHNWWGSRSKTEAPAKRCDDATAMWTPLAEPGKGLEAFERAIDAESALA